MHRILPVVLSVVSQPWCSVLLSEVLFLLLLDCLLRCLSWRLQGNSCYFTTKFLSLNCSCVSYSLTLSSLVWSLCSFFQVIWECISSSSSGSSHFLVHSLLMSSQACSWLLTSFTPFPLHETLCADQKTHVQETRKRTVSRKGITKKTFSNSERLYNNCTRQSSDPLIEGLTSRDLESSFPFPRTTWWIRRHLQLDKKQI